MKYHLQSTHYCTFSTIQVNALQGRSYFIPYPTKEEAISVPTTQKRYRSGMVKLLNGQWDFAFFKDPNDLKDEIDTQDMVFSKLSVPSVWQYKGICDPMYLNVRYPFSYKPPRIPTTESVGRYFSVLDGFKKAPETEKNYVGVYRTEFHVEDLTKDYEISFLGVASCIEVHVNGAFVGYSEESHNTAEFDITQYLKKGVNELVCVVRRWCNGSYLECQDMFRNNGIFRDVLLRISPKARIWDVDFKTVFNGKNYSLTAKAKVKGEKEVRITIQGHGIQKSQSIAIKDSTGEVTFDDLEVKEWNAEEPVLYDLFFETDDSCIYQKVGFKRIEIKGNTYLLNGKKVKFKGVNHHDTDPENGYCMTAEQIENDLRLCKEYNIDTVRTSHYAPDPLLMELASEMGLYIISEVDLETHGVFVMKLPPTYNRLSRDKRWKEHYLSRARRHYERDKINSTPIVMFSLGNESGGGCNTDAMYDYFKTVTNIPIHYESAIYTKRKAYDIASRMYPPVKELEDISKGVCKTKQFMDRPYFLCEYAHAMGVGPGNIEGYWKQIYSSDGLLGGCVWEMVDHSVLEKGTYTYGGDHGEWIHDGNFCCDGIFYPDRTPSTGAHIVRHAYRPIRVSHMEGNKFDIFNTTAFTEGSSFKLKVRIAEGEEITIVPTAGPMEHQVVELEIPECEGKDLFVDINTFDKEGRNVGTEQITLSVDSLENRGKDANLPSWFSLRDGLPVIKVKDHEITASDPYTPLFRAETDNDSINFMLRPMRKWYKQKTVLQMQKATPQTAVALWSIKDSGVTFRCSDVYQGLTLEDGRAALLVRSTIQGSANKSMMRFAKAFKMDESFENVTYKGRSGESYIDMKDQFPIKVCRANVMEMTEPNIRPQESGNRMDTRFVELESPDAKLRFDAVSKPFELSVKPYSDAELIAMKHRTDEVRSGTYVTLNAFQMGIGTGSCGPYVLKEHQYSTKDVHSFSFIITVEEKT